MDGLCISLGSLYVNMSFLSHIHTMFLHVKITSIYVVLFIMVIGVVLMQVYMVELYQDTLIDLLLPKHARHPKIDIKKDSKVTNVD